MKSRARLIKKDEVKPAPQPAPKQTPKPVRPEPKPAVDARVAFAGLFNKGSVKA